MASTLLPADLPMTASVQRFANVRRGEVPALLASVAFFFRVLTALMVVRPVVGG